MVGVLIIDTTNEIRASRAQLSIKKLVLPPTWALGLTVLIITAAVFHLAFLLRYPTVFVDEAWMASRAWAWLHTGVNVGPLDGIKLAGLDGYWTFYPLLPTLLHAATIRLIGLSVTSLRLLSLMFGFGLLIAVYIIAHELYRSCRTALITVLLVSTSFSFLFSSHLVRPDIFVATLGYTAIGLYLLGHNYEHPILHLMAGLLISLAFEIHPNAVIYGPVIVGLYLMHDGPNFIRQRGFWLFVGGTSLGLALYTQLHILPYPETYFTLMGAAQRTHALPISNRLSAVLDSLRETGIFLLAFTQFRIVATLIATVIVWRNRSVPFVKSLTMLVIGLAGFVLIVQNKMDYYAILVAPFANIVLGAGIDHILKWDAGLAKIAQEPQCAPAYSRRMTRLARLLAKAFVYSVILVSLIFSFNTVVKAPPPGDLDVVVKRVTRVAPRGGTIMGSHTFWFGLHQYDYQSWQEARSYQQWNPASSFEDAMHALRPDVLVIDGHMRLFIIQDQPPPPQSGFARYAWERRLRKEDVDSFLKSHGRLEDHFETGAYGTVEIYSLRWDDETGSAWSTCWWRGASSGSTC